MTGTDDRSKVAVLGAGVMGLGIGQVLAAAGHEVALFDPDPSARATVAERAEAICCLLEQGPGGVDRLRATGDLEEALAGAGLVVEAGPEDLDVKRRIFADVSELTTPGAALATNTSGIRVAALAESLGDHARRFLATHFWNPPYLVPLIEVVPGARTEPDVVTEICSLLSDAGMRPVRLAVDTPGFVGNRLQHALKREAIALVASGVCDAETVDTVTKWGFGLRLPVLGPLEQSDMVGLGLTLAIHKELMPSLDRTAVPHALLEEKVAQGQLGMATGEGFRTWTPEEADAVRRRVTEHLVDAARRRAQGAAPAGAPAAVGAGRADGEEGPR
ncbi:MAG: 3-hydroxyacyl-CoA dehydrogenase family protein [Acidimicrobiales bacterium]